MVFVQNAKEKTAASFAVNASILFGHLQVSEKYNYYLQKSSCGI